MNDELYDFLRKVIKAYAKRKYLQYTEDDFDFFGARIVDKLEEDNREITCETIEEYVKKYGNDINDEMDIVLLKLGVFTELNWRYKPLAVHKIEMIQNSNQKEIELSYGDIWCCLHKKLPQAQKNFKGENKNGIKSTFYTYYNTILKNCINDILKRKHNNNLEIEWNDNDKEVSAFEPSEMFMAYILRFHENFSELDFIEAKRKNKETSLKNLFRLLLLIYYYIPINRFGFKVVFGEEVINRIIRDLSRFKTLRKEQDKLDALYEYYLWLNVGKWTASTFQRFFKKNRKFFYLTTTKKEEIGTFKVVEDNEAFSIIIDYWYYDWLGYKDDIED